MTADEIKDWLDEEVAVFPKRASGEELYSYLRRRTSAVSKTDRASLVEALSGWLELRTEPKTMLAVDLASEHGLTEMRGEIAELLSEVRSGEAFLPFYERDILRALARL